MLKVYNVLLSESEISSTTRGTFWMSQNNTVTEIT